MRASSIALIASAALVAAIGAAAKWLSAPPLEDEPEPGRGSIVPRWGDGSNSSVVKRTPVDTFRKLLPGHSLRADGTITDRYEPGSPNEFAGVASRRCARQIALRGLPTEAQNYLEGFFARHNPALNQEIDCEGVEVPQAQVDSARKSLELLLPSVLKSEPTRRDLSLR